MRMFRPRAMERENEAPAERVFPAGWTKLSSKLFITIENKPDDLVGLPERVFPAGWTKLSSKQYSAAFILLPSF